jgi:hypothetical protein
VRVMFSALMVPHYYPMVPLAWAFLAAGHDVRVVGQPALTDVMVRSGLAVMPVGGSYDFATHLMEFHRQFPVHTPKDFLKFEAEERVRVAELKTVPILKSTEAMIEDLLPLLDQWRPDLIVSEPAVLVGPLVSQIIGVPLVRHLWGVDGTRRMGFPGQGQDEQGDWQATWPQSFMDLFGRYGVAARPDYAVATVDPCPSSMQLPGVPNRIPVRYVPYNGSGAIPNWLSEPPRKPRVCVTWGTTTTLAVGKNGYLVPDILTALRKIDVDVIVSVTNADRELLGEVPTNVRVVDQLPLNLVLPTCDAVVHHGGAGSTMTAAAHGIPQVIIPQFADQPLLAERLSYVGAGVWVDSEDCRIEDIENAVDTVLTGGSHREAALRLQDQIRAERSPAEIVGALTELV